MIPNPPPYEEVVFMRIFLPPSVGESRRQMIKKGDLKKQIKDLTTKAL
jgi:hypothetical protein